MSTAHAEKARYFAHPQALVESDQIGPGTRVWAFAHILSGARIGADCNICDHTLILGDAVIGDRVTVKSFVVVGDGLTLEDDVFVGPNVGFTSDSYPRSRHVPKTFPSTTVRRGASIGANASILPGLTIGSGAMIGAGAVVTRDVPPQAIVTGNPGTVTGYVDPRTDGKGRLRPCEIRPGPVSLAGGARLYELPRISDPRGHLSFAELDQGLPFSVARYFLVFGVPSRELRGEHAHRTLDQFLVCVHGKCSVRLFDGERSDEVLLNRPDLALHVPPMVWMTQYRFSEDAVLAVLASDVYRAGDYIRDLEEYLEARSQEPEARSQKPGADS
jgi:acetyltransferase-like isoleucine patch superfamily enzyme/dTDP-4-dehydrorhamnose 3,5-epimerase-like enzyme